MLVDTGVFWAINSTEAHQRRSIPRAARHLKQQSLTRRQHECFSSHSAIERPCTGPVEKIQTSMIWQHSKFGFKWSCALNVRQKLLEPFFIMQVSLYIFRNAVSRRVQAMGDHSISLILTGRPSFRDLVAAAAIRMGYRPSSPVTGVSVPLITASANAFCSAANAPV